MLRRGLIILAAGLSLALPTPRAVADGPAIPGNATGPSSFDPPLIFNLPKDFVPPPTSWPPPPVPVQQPVQPVANPPFAAPVPVSPPSEILTFIGIVIPGIAQASSVLTLFPLPTCYVPGQDTCNCSNFSTQPYAQWFHTYFDPTNINQLDIDSNGVVCKNLPPG